MWAALTNLGDAALTLPVAISVALWVGVSSRRLALRWLLFLAFGMVLVGTTKVLYAGCGIEIDAIGFRVISGHTMLASAIWTVVMALLFGSFGASRTSLGTFIGLLIGALIGVARLFDRSHTLSEVLAGWALGAWIGLLFIRAFSRASLRPRNPIFAGLGLLLVSGFAYGHHAPFQTIIERDSPMVCAPFTSATFRSQKM